MDSVLSGARNLMTKNMEKLRYSVIFFTQFSFVRSALWPPRFLNLLNVCRCEAVATVGEDRIREHLTHLDVHMGLDGMHLRMLE